MSDRLPVCLNCGAEIPLYRVSRSRRFASCGYCGTIMNVGEFFASQGRARAELTAEADIARAEAELPTGLGMILRRYARIVGVVAAGAYFPVGMLVITGSTMYPNAPPWWLFLLLLILLPFLGVGVLALVRRRRARQ